MNFIKTDFPQPPSSPSTLSFTPSLILSHILILNQTIVQNYPDPLYILDSLLPSLTKWFFLSHNDKTIIIFSFIPFFQPLFFLFFFFPTLYYFFSLSSTHKLNSKITHTHTHTTWLFLTFSSSETFCDVQIDKIIIFIALIWWVVFNKF